MDETDAPVSSKLSNNIQKHSNRRPLSQLNGIECKFTSPTARYSSPAISKSRSCHSIQEGVEDNESSTNNAKESPILFAHSSKSTPIAKHLAGGSSCIENSHHILSSHGRNTPSPMQINKNFITPLSSRNTRQSEQISHSSCLLKNRINPFEECPDILHLPTVSPSLFKEVVSPSQKEDANFWSVEQMAILHPVPIDTSPFQQCSMPQDPEYERKAQEAIDRFFCSNNIVPSPWTNSSSHSVNIMSAILSSKSSSCTQFSSASPALPTSYDREAHGDECGVLSPHSRNASCQTEMTFPPILPKEVEDILSKFCTFTQDQSWQPPDEKDDTSNLNASSLRRKLTFDAKELNNVSMVQNKTKNRSSSGSSTSSRAHSPSSVASVGALPFDDDENAKIQWGSSMIRNSSSKARLSPNNIQSMPSESPGAHSNSSGGHTPAHPYIEIDSSPICHLTPKMRMMPSPYSENQELCSHRIISPEVSPILCTTKSSNDGQCKFPAIKPSLTPITIAAKFPSFTYCNSDQPKKILYPSEESTISPPHLLLTSPNENFVKKDFSDIIDHSPKTSKLRKEIIQALGTPLLKPNLSPQFSSSPIRHKIHSEDCHRERSPFNLKAEAATPPQMRFSNSPPLSPIAWKEPQDKSQIDQTSDSIVLTYPNSPEMSTQIEERDCENRLSRYVSPSREESSCCNEVSSSPLIDFEKDVTMTGISQIDVLKLPSQGPFGITDMDTDSQPFLEGSCLEETTNAQDTGYCTGTSSFQTTL